MRNAYFKLLFALAVPLGLSSCSEAPANVTIGPFVGPIIGWQSYCPLVYDARAADRPPGKISIQRIKVTTRHSHSMFGFAKSGRIYLKDLVSGEQWTLESNRFIPNTPVDCGRFVAGGTTVSHGAGYVEACDTSCRRIEIWKGTWVYAYAYANNAILAATNFGDVIIYRNGDWCRTTKSDDDVYECPKDDKPDALQKPRKVQFYSSLSFNDHALVGEWPTGRIYRFDGDTLTPIKEQPPFVTSEPVGYEAQSMVAHCGNLYVGYWPTGEIWKLHSDTGEWSIAVRLFDNSPDFIPYLNRQNNEREAVFYGRRISALIPHEDSLIAATSNLSGWEAGYLPRFLSETEAEQYGSVYKISINCRSKVGDPTSLSEQ